MVIRAEFILKVLSPDALPAHASARRISALNHKIRDDAMKNQAVIVTVFGVRRKILDRLWSGVRKEENLNFPHRRFHCSGDIPRLRFAKL